MWRALQVGDVVASLAVEDVRIAGGGDGLDRSVVRPRVASSPADLDGAGRGDLVITSSSTLAAGPDGPRLLEALDAASVAGLAVRLDLPDLPDQLSAPLLAAAERLALPVVTFPAGAALADLAAAVLDGLLSAQRTRLERVLAVHERFARIVLGGGGPAAVGAALHEVLGCTIAIVDPDGHPLVVVPAGAPDAGAALDGSDAQAGTVRQSIRAGDHDYGAVVAVTGGRALGQEATMAMERAAVAVAMRQAQAMAVAEAEERFAAISLEELVSGHVTTAAEVAERSASFGWDLGRPRAVLLASVDPPTDPPALSTALGTIAAAARATLGPDAIVWRRSATIAALVAPETDDAAERRHLAEALRAELDRRVRSVTVSIGVGRRVADPVELSRSLAEASRAVEVGRWAKGRHVTEVFDQLGLERLLAATPADELVEFVRQAIGPLVDHDRRHGGELLDTLAMWLETRNMAEAARRLHVHYNTLKNRMERIEAILGPVVSDGRQALECEVAIHVARHYDIDVPGLG